jgi:hypothetical protein
VRSAAKDKRSTIRSSFDLPSSMATPQIPDASVDIHDSIAAVLEVAKNNELLKAFLPTTTDDDKKRKFTSTIVDKFAGLRMLMKNPPHDSAYYWLSIGRWLTWISRAKDSKTTEKKFAMPEVLADMLVEELPEKVPLLSTPIRKPVAELLEKLELTPSEWATLYDAVDDVCKLLDE